MGGSVPIFDVSGERLCEQRELVERIALACREWGFFRVVGHGVPEDLRKRFYREQKVFFALPGSVKASVRRSGGNAWGYFDRELTQNVRDWKEIFDFGRTPQPSLPDDHPCNRCCDGRNLWPQGYPSFELTMKEYFRACETLAFRLLEVLCAGLGAPRDRLHSHFIGRHTSFLRLNHYPRCENPAPPEAGMDTALGHFGVNRHTDAGAFTILCQDGLAGLQAYKDGRWLLVDPAPDALLVNVGDMLQVWSNDRYRAPLHRVLASRSYERFSAPFFFNPAHETECAPLECAVDAESPPRYRSVHWGEFRRRRSDRDYSNPGEAVQLARYRLDGQNEPAPRA